MTPSAHAWSLTEQFNQYFRVVYAHSPSLRTVAHQIRYHVYCEEFGYEDPQAFQDQCERDDDDECSDHALLIHTRTGQAVGCTRLVGARGLPIGKTFPFEEHCREALDPARFDLSHISRQDIGEFSRLAVLPQYRRRRDDESRPVSMPSRQTPDDDRRTVYPLISLGLFMCSLSMLCISGLTYGVAIMEPRLARKLRWHGLRFDQIGEKINFRGTRAPYVITPERTKNELSDDMADMQRELTQQLLSSLSAPLSDACAEALSTPCMERETAAKSSV